MAAALAFTAPPAVAGQPGASTGQAGPYAGQAGEPAARSAAPHGPLDDARHVVGVFWGYGFPHVINGSAEIDIASAGLRWTHVFSHHGGAGFFSGRPAFGVELLPVSYFIDDRRRVYSGGLNLLYEHRFARGRRLLPVWRIGAGLLIASDQVPAGETRLNFSLLTGVGIDFLLTERTGLQVEYRFHHVSNANLGRINPGINAHTALVGYTLYR